MAGIYLGSTDLSSATLYGGSTSVTKAYIGSNLVFGTTTPQPVLTDLVYWIDANDPSSYPGSGTTVTDVSGQGNTTTMYNSLPWTTSGGISYWDWGNSQNTYHMKANNSTSLQATTAVSIEAWINFNSVARAKDGEQHIVVKSNTNTWNSTASAYVARLRPDAPTVSVMSWVTDWGQQKTSAYTFSINTWYHLVYTWENASKVWKHYLGGALVNTTGAQTSTSISTGAAPLYIGAHPTGNNGQPSFKLGLVRIYKNRALDATEVLQNYDASKGTYGL